MSASMITEFSITKDSEKGLWDELIQIKSIRNDQLLPGERTTEMLKKEYKLSERQIRTKLKNLQDMGLITKRRVILDGHSYMAYTIKNLA